MQKFFSWVLAATLVCGASVLTACSSNEDNPVQPELKTNIDETKFPDDNFRNYLLEQDYGKDGVLTELFNGVIHPAAGLFEDYFDVDKAAEEHRGYVSMLEQNGIRVHTVTDILQEVGIDSLRTLAANVLVYDISAIPDENAEATEEYRQDVLSKMSRADLIRCILLQPTVKLWKTDNNTGYEAVYIQNPLMNLYFTRDQSITTPRGHVICNMNSSQRSPEINIIELC